MATAEGVVQRLCPNCGRENILAHSGIPPLYLLPGAPGSLPDIRPFDAGRLASAEPLLMVTAYCANIAGEIAGGRGMLLHGKGGVGKSHLAAWLALAAVEAGCRVRFATMVGIVSEVKAWYGEKEGKAHPLERYMAADFLVLDDIGAERATDHTSEVTFALVNERMNGKRATVYTTNHSPETLGQHLAPGDRIAAARLTERICGLAYAVPVEALAGSYRFTAIDEHKRRLMGA